MFEMNAVHCCMYCNIKICAAMYSRCNACVAYNMYLCPRTNKLLLANWCVASLLQRSARTPAYPYLQLPTIYAMITDSIPGMAKNVAPFVAAEQCAIGSEPATQDTPLPHKCTIFNVWCL